MKDEKLKEMVKAALKSPISEKSTDKYDNNPALKGKQSELPDGLQKAIIKKSGGKVEETIDEWSRNLGENIDSKILAHLKSEKDPTDESKPFDIDKLVNVKKTDRR